MHADECSGPPAPVLCTRPYSIVHKKSLRPTPIGPGAPEEGRPYRRVSCACHRGRAEEGLGHRAGAQATEKPGRLGGGNWQARLGNEIIILCNAWIKPLNMRQMGVFFAEGMCFDTTMEGNGGPSGGVPHCAKVRALSLALRHRGGAERRAGASQRNSSPLPLFPRGVASIL